MSTADVLNEMVNKLEESAIEIESKSRRMFEGTRLNSIPNPNPYGPTHIWAKPKDNAWLELQRSVTREYQIWYSAASQLIKKYSPNRESEFTSCYSCKDGFRLGGVFNALWLNAGERDGNVEAAVDKYMNIFEMQRSLLLSIPAIAETNELDLRIIISNDLVNSEIGCAGYIFQKDKTHDYCLRVAGILAGIALERHLKTKCELEAIPLPAAPTLYPLIDALHKANKITPNQKAYLEAIAKTRNDCAHATASVSRTMVGEAISNVKKHLEGNL